MNATIKLYLRFLGFVLTISGVFWLVRDLVMVDHDRWTWFSRTIAGALVLGISALIPDKE